jgi:hypothetical protein
MSPEILDSNGHSSETSRPTNSADIPGTEISNEGLNGHISQTSTPSDPTDSQGTEVGNDDSNDHISEASKPLDSADIRGTEVGTDAAVFLGNPGLDNTASDAQPLAKIGAIAEKAKPGVYFITNKDGEEEAIGDDDPRLDGLSKYVRKIVDFQDDPNPPTLTFRYFLLSIFFIIPGAFLSQMSHFHTTSAPYSVFFVQSKHRPKCPELAPCSGIVDGKALANYQTSCKHLCWRLVGESPSCVGSQSSFYQVELQLEPGTFQCKGTCTCDYLCCLGRYV